MRGIPTFYVPSQISTSLNCKKTFWPLYSLDIVYIALLHLKVVVLMPQKIENQKYLKISKGMKNVRIPHILCTLSNLDFLDFYSFLKLTSHGLDIV